MKNRNALLLCLALPTLALPAATSAAPKSKLKPQVARVKWEYCSMRYGSRSKGGLGQSGVEVFLPQSRVLFQPINRGQEFLAVATQVLNRLGEQGWELVSYNAENSQVWTLKRRK